VTGRDVTGTFLRWTFRATVHSFLSQAEAAGIPAAGFPARARARSSLGAARHLKNIWERMGQYVVICP
jgi:hypothetical protein